MLFVRRTVQGISFVKSPHLLRLDKSKWSECVGTSCREPPRRTLGGEKGGKLEFHWGGDPNLFRAPY